MRGPERSGCPGKAAGRDESGYTAGMTRNPTLLAIFHAAVLSTVLSVSSLAQSAAPEMAKPGQSSAQQMFRITPVRPIAELRAEALKAAPPEERGPFERSELVELADREGMRLEIRYATANNFLAEPLYEQARAFLELPATVALMLVGGKLREKGYGLLVYDAYRPWYVTKIFWEATPADRHEFVADPAEGSRHNRGCSVDLTLYDLKTGAAVAMPSQYDEMTPRAYANYAGASPEETKHRDVLRKAMESEGFVQRPNEWWHYDYKDWQKYEILNLAFDRIPYPIHLVGKGVITPKILRRVNPEFTADARHNKIQGTVVMFVVLDVDGKPRDIHVLRSLGHGLDEAAIKAMKQWRFQPGTQDGKAVPVLVTAEVKFHLF
jgi:zinc D-Ala-D-Ala dipeptidase